MSFLPPYSLSHHSLMVANPSLPIENSAGFVNHLLDVDLGYAEEAALLAEMKTLKAHVAAHCANAEKRRFTTQTTSFLRDIVQHLPETPMQVPGARASILANLVGCAHGNVIASLTPLSPVRESSQSHVGVARGPASMEVLRKSTVFRPTTTPIMTTSAPFSTTAGGHRGAHAASESPPSVSYLTYTPRGQKRAHEDTWDDSPRMRTSPISSTPNGRSIHRNTPGSSPELPSTPHGRHSFPAFVVGPPDTPSPRGSARKSAGTAYLSGTFRARRSLPQRQPSHASSVLPFGPLGLEDDEIPRFPGGL
ncbi:hypothetical protein B0H19DRAFT_1249021 [Mycena capillaripes]|nr:hypothetical protein B0H19DRAFT_1249021 [Mycena capillaripes]